MGTILKKDCLCEFDGNTGNIITPRCEKHKKSLKQQYNVQKIMIIILCILALGVCFGGLYLAYIAMGWSGVLLAIAMGTLIHISFKNV